MTSQQKPFGGENVSSSPKIASPSGMANVSHHHSNAQMGYSIQAQDVLYNTCDDLRNALFNSLDGGYGDAYLLEGAQEAEALLIQANQRATRGRR